MEGLEKGFAPAKVNLALHVTGRGSDGYHHLDSLVAFAGIGDRLSARAAAELSLVVEGPFARGVPTDGSNLVLRAARALAEARGVTRGAALRLTKALPHAAGLGSGSSDAAAAIRFLAQFWDVEPFAPDAPEVLALGSDVPACLAAPQPLLVRGQGEVLEPAPALPPLGLVLVNPGVEVPTREVFARLHRRENPPLPPLPEGLDLPGLLDWLGATRNDLQAAAEAVAPEITAVLERLRRAPGVLMALMSGSGATCVGITRNLGTARDAARMIQIAASGWWVAPAPLLGSPVAAVAAGVPAGPQVARVTT